MHLRLCSILALSVALPTCAAAQARRGAPAKPDTLFMRLEWAIESATSPIADSFGMLSSVALDARGNGYAADALASVIWTFNRAGKPLQAIGRKGDGPGEFTRPGGLGISAAGVLFVRDVSRYTRFGLNERTGLLSQYLGGFRRQAMSDVGSMQPSRFDAAGNLYEPYFHSIDRTGASYGRYYKYTTEGTRLDSLIVSAFPGAPISTARIRENRGGGRMLVGLDHVPFAPLPTWDVTVRGTILTGRGSIYQIEERDRTGRVVQSYARQVPSVPIPRAERAESLASLSRRLDSVPIPLNSVVGLSESVRRRELPTNFPPIMIAYGADDGSTWVRRWVPAQPSRTIFDVFNANGEFVSVVVLPRRVASEPRPVLRLDRIFAVCVDAETGEHSLLSFARSPVR